MDLDECMLIYILNLFKLSKVRIEKVERAVDPMRLDFRFKYARTERRKQVSAIQFYYAMPNLKVPNFFLV
jgi:hypothetical protein